MIKPIMQKIIFNFKITGMIFAFSLISACATVSETYLPSGEKGYNIGCDGSAMSWNLCYEKAGEICKARGYHVIKKTGDSNPLLAPQQNYKTGNYDYKYVGNYVSRSLLIKCK